MRSDKEWHQAVLSGERETRLTSSPGGYPRQFSVGVCRQGSQTLTLFKGGKSRINTLLKAQNQEMAPYLRETR